MLARRAARLVTGPIAFLLAGVLDVTTLWTRWALHRASVRLARLRAR